MIWSGGQIVQDDELKISVLDRTFEHGLGLFETFRTWNGIPVLLTRHLERMQNSAKHLELALDFADLPDAAAVIRLNEAENAAGDRMFRITMSGGSARLKPVVWMRAAPLPPPTPSAGIRVRREEIADDDLARHKTLNYWSRRRSYERALSGGDHETLLATADGKAWSGSRTNLFAVRRGTLLTPPLMGPLIPGIMRELVLKRAAAIGVDSREETLSLDALRTASELFLTNAVRGIMPVANFENREYTAPGPITCQLRDEVWRWLNCGGVDQ